MSREDEERIDIILTALRDVWRLRSDKRLGQLLVDIDCEVDSPNLFMLSDLDLLKVLNKKYEEFIIVKRKAEEEQSDEKEK